MDPAIVSALSAVLGSAVGGSATLATAWITQKTQSRREAVGAEIRKRESLYGEFIAECSKLATDAVVAAADQTLRHILKQYFEQNMTPQAFREELSISLTDDRTKRDDALKPFSEVCRNELRALQH